MHAVMMSFIPAQFSSFLDDSCRFQMSENGGKKFPEHQGDVFQVQPKLVDIQFAITRSSKNTNINTEEVGTTDFKAVIIGIVADSFVSVDKTVKHYLFKALFSCTCHREALRIIRLQLLRR